MRKVARDIDEYLESVPEPAFSTHCSFFPYGAPLIKEFKRDLEGFQTSEGTVRFPPDQPLSTTLVKKFIRTRVVQNEGQKKR